MCTTRFQGCPSKILRYEGTGVNHFLGGIRIFCDDIQSEMSEILEIRTFMRPFILKKSEYLFIRPF